MYICWTKMVLITGVVCPVEEFRSKAAVFGVKVTILVFYLMCWVFSLMLW